MSAFIQENRRKNGRHERMHRTLKLETATPPAFNLKEQQDRFDEFKRCFNNERSHEALSYATPDSVYVASARPYPNILTEPEYSDQYLVRNVRKDGDIKLEGKHIFVSGVLSHERVVLLKVEEELYDFISASCSWAKSTRIPSSPRQHLNIGFPKLRGERFSDNPV